jgi:tetratricopeptide (TPR) repeat protein
LAAEYEHLLPIAGMACPDTLSAEVEPTEVGQYSAVRLFVESARRVRPEFGLTPSNQANVAAICRSVDGLPLAILLAAAWIGVLTPAEIARQLEPAPPMGPDAGGEHEPSTGLDFLGLELRDLPLRHRGIRVVFDGSWALLSPHERAVMQALSVFRGGFAQHAAQQVAGAALHDLARLESKSLLQRASADSAETTSRYEIHELLRQYAAERLAAEPDHRSATLDRHCEYYAAALARWDAALKGPGQQAALAEMEREIENARAAWAWAVKGVHERTQVELLAQALDGLCRFFDWRVRFEDGVAMCRAAAERLEGTVDPDRLCLLSRVRTWQSALYQRMGETQRAGQLAQESLALLGNPELDACDTRVERALALLQRGRVAHVAGELRKAERPYASSGALFEALEDRWNVATALHARGNVAWAQGAYTRAGRLHEEALAMRRQLGDRRMIAESLASLSLVRQYQGETGQAAHLARESLAIRRKLGEQADIGQGIKTLGLAFIGLGKYAEARELLEESLVIQRKQGYRAGIADTYPLLAFTSLALGRYDVARSQAQTSVEIARQIDYLMVVGRAHGMLGACALAEDAYTKAWDLFQESIRIFRRIGQRDDLSWVLAGAAVAGLWSGQRHQAIRHLSQALHIAAELRNQIPLIYALPATALLLIKQGHVERALELYAMMSRFPAFANCRAIEDAFERHILPTAANLPLDVAAAARARGQAKDPALTVAELLIELDVARFLPGPLGRLGRPLARMLRPVLTLLLRRGS